jgi:adenine-specific DNA-methyltransferase
MTTSPLEKFQQLLRELFQFDCADLEFGIYQIMNYKRDAVERFIIQDLPQNVTEALEHGALAEQTQARVELAEARKKVLDALGDDALDAAGNLVDEALGKTKAGKEYLAARAKATGARGPDALEALIYNHLFACFSHYYQDGDFISKRRYSTRQERYAIPYNGEEVMLYWANHDQYYVKTAEYFIDYAYTAPNGVTVHFKLAAADVEQNNIKGEKRFFVPRLDAITWNAVSPLPADAVSPLPRGEGSGVRAQLTIPFEYRPLTGQEAIAYGGKNQQEAILARAVKEIPRRLSPAAAAPALAALSAEKRRTAGGEPVSYLEHHLRQYTRRNTSDFFIHKDLKGFLTRELDFYLKNEVLSLDEMAAAGEGRAEGWFQIMAAIRAVGGRIIEFLAQVEEFQKLLWEKRKFITETFYCVTVGAIGPDFHPEIATCDTQWEEWKVLFHIDEEQADLFDDDEDVYERRDAFLQAHPTLVLDTRHFGRDFVDRLLGSFDDLDEMTDGLLVHSENWQALNLLVQKYREKVKCIYIDPPYNTDASAILYKNGYKVSSWISLLNCCVGASKLMLTENGVFVAAIDDEQQRELSFILSNNFRDRLLGTICVRSNPSGRPTQTGYSVSHEYLLFAGRSDASGIGRMPPTDEQMSRFSERDEYGPFEWRNLRREGSNSDRSARRALYYPVYIRDTSIRVPAMTWDDQAQEWNIQDRPKSDEQVVWPDNEEGIEKTWRWEGKTVTARLSDLSVRKDRSGRDYIYYKRRPHDEGVVSVSSWFDAKYSATEHGTALLKDLFGRSPFSYPKSIYAVVDTIYVAGASRLTVTVLDYFAGSGTTAHAVINLNREDAGRRKFILVEMAVYFDTVLLPRIKKVTYTPEWKDGEPKRTATAEEAERGPRIVKVIRLESYEDSLNNIAFDDAGGQQALEFEDYLLRYMLKWEARKSETLLDIEKLASPFQYTLHIHADGQTSEKAVDLPETFAYLLGLHVQARHAYDDGGRRYLVYRGRIAQRTVAVIWRETDGWGQADYEADRQFVAEHKLTDGAEEIFVNGDSLIPGARALEPLFKARMFAPVEA